MPDVVLDSQFNWGGIRNGMQEMRSFVGQTTKGIKGDVAGMFAGTISISAITAGIKSLVSYGSTIQDLSDRFKVGSTELQQFGEIAEESGSSLEGLAKGFNRLSVALSQARMGNTDMQRTLERLNIDNWADRALTLSDAALKVGTSSMEAADMVKVFGREGTALAETFKYAAENADKLGKAISPEMIKKLDEADDRLKRFWMDLRVGAAGAIEWFDKLGRAFDEFVGIHHAGPVDPQTGLPPGFKVLTPGVPGGPPGNKPLKDDIDLTNQLNEADQRRWDTLQQINRTLEAEEALRLAGLTHAQRLSELTTQRDALEQQLNQEIAAGGDQTERALELREQIANIMREIIPLETQVANEEERAATAAKEVAKAAAEYAAQMAALREAQNETIRAGIELDVERGRISSETAGFEQRSVELQIRMNELSARINDARASGNELLAQQLEIEQGITAEQNRRARDAAFAEQLRTKGTTIGQPGTDALGRMAAAGLHMGGLADAAYFTALMQGASPAEAAAAQMKMAARMQVDQLTGRDSVGFAERAQLMANMQTYLKQQQFQAQQQSDQSLRQQIAYWGAIAAGRQPAGNNPYLGMYGVPNFGTGQFAPLGAGGQADLLAILLRDLQGQGVTQTQLLQAIASNTSVVTI